MRTHGEATTELHAYRPIDRPRLDRDHEIVEALRMQEPTAAERFVAAYRIVRPSSDGRKTRPGCIHIGARQLFPG